MVVREEAVVVVVVVVVVVGKAVAANVDACD